MRQNSKILLFGITENNSRNIFDGRYLKNKNIETITYDFSEYEKLDEVFQTNDILFLVTRNIYQFQEWKEISNKLVLLKNKYNINLLIIDILYPNHLLTEEMEKDAEENFIYISDVINKKFKNRISEPLYGIINQEQQHFDRYRGLYAKEFVNTLCYNYLNPTYDLLLKVGKTVSSDVRKLVLLKTISKKFKNSWINVSYSIENHLSEKDTIPELKKEFKNLSEKFELQSELDDLNICCYLGAAHSPNKINKCLSSDGGTFDLNSCAEIYMESLTSKDFHIERHSESISFTEKTFNVFAGFKIPLPIDTEVSIRYLKEVGFRFPIEPLYLYPNEPIDKFNDRLDVWLENLKTVDFRKMWEEMIYDPESIIHHNKKLINKFKTTRIEYSYHAREIEFSLLHYLMTYRVIDMLYNDKLSEYINFDFQSYSYLKTIKLID